jgi:dihydrofolate synthase/folylpolyglutamate synthase
MDYKAAKTYLNSFINYEKKEVFPYSRALKLERVTHLFEMLNIAYRRLKTIHVAGTKGKGSTATFCAYILAASGYKVGLYTSPHFFDFRERIRILKPSPGRCVKRKPPIESKIILQKEVVRIVRQFKPTLDALRSNTRWGKITFFEVYTAVAIQHFLAQGVDFVVLETGLGGRLDATNIITPLIAIITHIGYDHTHTLGKRLKDIASEKAGIIKKNIPVVTTQQRRSALTELKKKARDCRSTLFVLGKDFNYRRIRMKKNNSLFDFYFGKSKVPNIKILPRGIHQIENATLALESLYLLQDEGIVGRSLKAKKGLAHCSIEGRFEVISRDPLMVVDIAHNPSSFAALGSSLRTYFPQRKIILIFGASKGKDIKNMLNKIIFDKIIITSFSNPRSMPPKGIGKCLKLKDMVTTCNVNEALHVGMRYYTPRSLILVAGSFFLAAEVKALLQKKVPWNNQHFVH